MDKNALLKEMDDHLFGWAIGDIEKASVKGSAKLAGFILGACFIDAMAGFYAGIDRKTAKNGSGPRFKHFVEKYLKQYDAQKLYEDLRCGLVHSYSEGGTYVFTDANKDGEHFDKTPRGKILLNLEDFVEDLKSAYQQYRLDLLSDDSLFKKAQRRYLSMKLMMPIDIEDS
jgi:hypothetical protein